MTRHYGNDDLLAHAYLPDENADLALHLASCEVCEKRFGTLREELKKHAAPSDGPEKPETFWKRQEIAVMRTIDKRQRRMPGLGARIAAAAAVVFVVAAFWAGRGSVATAPLTSTMATTTIASTTTASANATQDNGLATSQISTDPWQSEQLQDFQTVVAWETWVDDDQKKRGTI